MTVTIPARDVGEVRDRIIEKNEKWSLEDGCENYIKRELRIE
jgi:hypothetical protein